MAAPARTPERILVRLPNWLGDVLLARPMLHAVRAGLPGARVLAVGPAPLLDLLAADGVFDLTESWPPAGAGRAAALRRVRDWRPEVALVLPPSFSSAWFALRSGARRRIGYAADGRSAFLTAAPRRPARGDRHLSEEYLALAVELGAGPVATPPLALPAGAHDAAAQRLRALVPGGRPVAVLGPGAAYGPAKRWPASRFAEVGRALAARGLAVLACGTVAERAACEEVAAGIGPSAIVLAGETGLLEMAGLAAAAAVAVCNDSGLAHLCASVGAPTVTVFGSTSSAWTAPLGPRTCVRQRPPVCSPCFRRTCRIGYRCLEAVDAAGVTGACEAAMAGAA